MKKSIKYKLCFILISLMIVGIVAIFTPEYAENVARALMLVIAGV